MIIRNAEVFTEEGIFEKKDICIRDGKFVSEDSGEDQEILDGSGCYAIPGLTDIHFHGCVGYDFCDGTEEAIQAIADYQASVGVTTIVPATMTFSEDKLAEIGARAKAHKNQRGGRAVRDQYGRTVYCSGQKRRAEWKIYPQTGYCHV